MTHTPDQREKAIKDKFEHWFYTARDPEKDMPYGSHLIYRVCDNDAERFYIGFELLEVAFTSGHEAALTAPPSYSSKSSNPKLRQFTNR